MDRVIFPDEAHVKAEMLVFLNDLPAGRGVWLFAYGALMAKPGIASPDIVAGARLDGFLRSYSLYDVMDRGTLEAPGLTLALEKGPEGAHSACAGFLLHVPGPDPRKALWPAWKQEMQPGFYEPCWVDCVMVPSEARVRALTFVPKRSHPLYAGRLPVRTVASRVARARGKNGTAADYLLDAIEAMDGRKLRDPGLEMLRAEVARTLVEGPVSRPTVRVSPAW